MFHHIGSSSTGHDFGRRASDIEFYASKGWIFLLDIDSCRDESISITTIDLCDEMWFSTGSDEMFDETRRIDHISISRHKFSPCKEMVFRSFVTCKDILYNKTIWAVSDTIHWRKSENHHDSQ